MAFTLWLSTSIIISISIIFMSHLSSHQSWYLSVEVYESSSQLYYILSKSFLSENENIYIGKMKWTKESTRVLVNTFTVKDEISYQWEIEFCLVSSGIRILIGHMWRANSSSALAIYLFIFYLSSNKNIKSKYLQKELRRKSNFVQ